MAEKPTAAFVISFIGGILGLVLGVSVAGGWYPFLGKAYDVYMGAYWIALAVATILVAVMMYSKPSSARTWSLVVIVLSILSGLNILTLIGGILGYRWKPTGAVPPPPPPPPP